MSPARQIEQVGAKPGRLVPEWFYSGPFPTYWSVGVGMAGVGGGGEPPALYSTAKTSGS
jgi:hypothetical protein